LKSVIAAGGFVVLDAGIIVAVLLARGDVAGARFSACSSLFCI
jgi:hypothetical protein